MVTDKLKHLKLADPFMPFDILLANGGRVHIDVSYHVAIAPDGSRVIAIDKSGAKFFWPNEISGVEEQTTPSAAI